MPSHGTLAKGVGSRASPWPAVILLGLSACTPGSTPRATVQFAPTWELRARARPLIAEHAAVASNSEIASAVGVEILRRGGNAVDAAVATGFALAVTHPEAASLGGGGFLVIRLSRDSGGPSPDSKPIVATLDFRETAPAAARRDMFSSAAPDRVSSTVGYTAVAVPAMVAGLTEALARYGTLPLETVMAPAIALAESGFLVDSLLAKSLLHYQGKIARFGGRALWIPGGSPLSAGDTLRQPALARTLRAIGTAGADAFYRGPIAARIVADVRRGGGLLRDSDLASYRTAWRDPVLTTYRGYTLLGGPLPSSGLLTAGEALMLMEATGEPAPFGSTRSLHTVAAALQRAFIDRSRLGDPTSTTAAAVHAMRDPERLAAIARAISPLRAAVTADMVAATEREGMETTHWSVVDRWGNAVAVTSTINDMFGSGVFVPDVGIFLSDTMDDFAADPGRADQWGLVSGEANAVGPGKRPLSSMTPVIVLDPQQRVVLIAGARGGPRIISTIVQMVVNVVDHGMSVTDAISAPRIHHQASPDLIRYDDGGFPTAVLDSLRAMGYTLVAMKPDTLPYIGRAVAIGRSPNGWEAVVDPRFGALSAGY